MGFVTLSAVLIKYVACMVNVFALLECWEIRIIADHVEMLAAVVKHAQLVVNVSAMAPIRNLSMAPAYAMMELLLLLFNLTRITATRVEMLVAVARCV